MHEAVYLYVKARQRWVHQVHRQPVQHDLEKEAIECARLSMSVEKAKYTRSNGKRSTHIHIEANRKPFWNSKCANVILKNWLVNVVFYRQIFLKSPRYLIRQLMKLAHFLFSYIWYIMFPSSEWPSWRSPRSMYTIGNNISSNHFYSIINKRNTENYRRH